MSEQNVAEARRFLLNKYPDFPIPKKSYLIFSSPRSGSNLLCSHLEKLGYGRAVEAFKLNRNHQLRYNWGIDYSDPCAFTRKAIEYQTKNDVLGAKFMPNQFILFLDYAQKILDPVGLQLSDVEIVDTFFPNARFVHLQRKMKIEQAISYSKALQNGIWRETVDQSQDYKEYLLPAIYDRDHIECCFDILISNDIFWQKLLTKNKLDKLVLWYEDFTADYKNTMKKVSAFLEIQENDIVAPPLKKQANKESKDWENRFVSETPWATKPMTIKSLQLGDLETLYIIRTRQIIQDREQVRWHSMPAIRYKKIRSFLFRSRRKILSLLNN